MAGRITRASCGVMFLTLQRRMVPWHETLTCTCGLPLHRLRLLLMLVLGQVQVPVLVQVPALVVEVVVGGERQYNHCRASVPGFGK